MPRKEGIPPTRPADAEPVSPGRRGSRPAGLAGVLLLTTVACGGDGMGAGSSASADPFCRAVLPRVEAFLAEGSAQHPPPDDPRYGGTAVLGNIAELADGMNSAVATSFYPRAHQMYVNLMPLVRYDSDLLPEPYLAESWTISPDGRELTFRIRRDVLWHDGERTDAHDVAFTYRLIADPTTAFPLAAHLERYDTSPEGIEVMDDYTVRVRLEPHSDFLDLWTQVGILPEHLLRDVPPAELRRHPFGTVCPVGNGPFVFTEHRPQDRWVFSANPLFPEALGGRPFLDRYVYRVIPEPATLLTELFLGNIDLYLRPPVDQARRIAAGDETELQTFPWREYTFVVWNQRRPHLADARVRRALTLGIDRRTLAASVLQGFGSVANSGVPPFHWAYDASFHRVRHDPDSARALLEEAGWIDRDGDGIRESSEGLRLSISVKYNTGSRQRQDVTEILQAQLVEIGVEIRPEVVEIATLIRQINDPDDRAFDGATISAIEPFRLDHTDRFHSRSARQPWAYAGVNNPRIDRLLERLATTVDREEARPVWAEYQRAVAEEAPYTYLFFPDGLAGIGRRLRGARMDARGELATIREWYLDPAPR